LDAVAEGNIQVGSTATTAVLVGNHLYVANVGDSRAVISKAGKGSIFFLNFLTHSFSQYYIASHVTIATCWGLSIKS